VANEHTEAARIADVLGVLGDGGDVAVVSDAGTPGVSDPGERLTRAALDAGYAVSAVPGPVAAVTALVISGLPTSRYVFEGFLPRSGRDRSARLTDLAAERRTVVLYEAPHRIVRTLTDLAAACGPDRRVAVCRELTKLYEEVLRGPLAEVADRIGDPRGEYVVVLDGAPAPAPAAVDDTAIRAALTAELARGASRKDAAAAVAERLAIPKKHAYTLAAGLPSSSS
jgi:16S rRNA (cytidine1402-2'-O)-methyltransferase